MAGGRQMGQDQLQLQRQRQAEIQQAQQVQQAPIQQVQQAPVQQQAQQQRLNFGMELLQQPVPTEELTQEQKRELAQVSGKSKRKLREEEMRQENRDRVALFESNRQRDVSAMGRAQSLMEQKNLSSEQTQQRNSALEKVEEINEALLRVQKLDLSEDSRMKLSSKMRSVREVMLAVEQCCFQTVPVNNQEAFEVQLNILQSMIGVLKTKADEAKRQVFATRELTDNQVASLVLSLNGSSMFEQSRLRLSDVSRQAQANGEQVRWGELLERAKGERVVNTQGKQLGKTGDAISSVTTIGTGDDTLFYKDNVKILGDSELLRYALENVTLQNKQERNALRLFCTDGSPTLFDDMLNLVKQNKGMSFLYRLNTEDKEELKDRVERALNTMQVVTGVSLETICELLDIYLRQSLAKDVGSEIGLEADAKLTERNLATTRIAELLGAESLIARSERATLHDGTGTDRQGFVMSKAAGQNFDATPLPPGSVDAYSPQFMRQMINLQLLDNICGQRDRHVNNIFYSVHIENGQVIFDSVQGIDNDMAFGTEYPMTAAVGHMCGCLQETDGSYVLPYVDREFYEHLKVLTPEVVAANMEGLIEPQYIAALTERLERLRKGIDLALERGCRLLSGDEWGAQEVIDALHRTPIANYVSRHTQERNVDRGM